MTLYGIFLAIAMAMEELRDWIALHRICWTRPQSAWDMVLRCGDVVKLLHGKRSTLCSILDSDWSVIEQLRRTIDWRQADRDCDFISKKKITITPRGHPQFPLQLEFINDPPLLLFWRGTIPGWDHFTGIAIVGARKATAYGREVVDVLAAGFLQDPSHAVTIVSGLAFGIDAQAHRAAIANRGQTIAVLASGVDDITPHQHQKLGELVTKNGALVSEAPIGEPAYPANFLSRNRIISGLSQATIVVEAETRSGSLVTARHAADQGREAFAVPGPITSPLSAGCNQLIRDGAIPCCNANDIIEAISAPRAAAHDEAEAARGGAEGLSPSRAPVSKLAVRYGDPCERGDHPSVTGPQADSVRGVLAATGPVMDSEESIPHFHTSEKYGHSKPLDDTTARLFETLSTGPCTANDLGERLDMPIAKVLQLLTELECAGMLKVLPGGFVSRK